MRFDQLQRKVLVYGKRYQRSVAAGKKATFAGNGKDTVTLECSNGCHVRYRRSARTKEKTTILAIILLLLHYYSTIFHDSRSNLDAIVRAFLHVTGATRDQSLLICSNALVAGLAVVIAVTVTLAPAKGIDRHGPRTVAFPIDQVRVVGRNVAGVDAIVRVGRMGSATAAVPRH
jgi:hypothetical protein